MTISLDSVLGIPEIALQILEFGGPQLTATSSTCSAMRETCSVEAMKVAMRRIPISKKYRLDDLLLYKLSAVYLRKKGRSRDEVLDLIFRVFCSLPSSHVYDKKSRRQDFDILAFIHTVRPELVPMLRFFVNAQDNRVRQPAASSIYPAVISNDVTEICRHIHADQSCLEGTNVENVAAKPVLQGVFKNIDADLQK